MARGRDNKKQWPGESAENNWLRRGFMLSLVAVAVGLLTITRRLLGHRPPTTKPRPAFFKPSEFKPGGRVVVKGGLALVRDGAQLIGLKLVCPHLGCRPRWQAGQNLFVCPCHGSLFAPDGARRRGPATRGLTRLRVFPQKDGRLRLDPAKPLPGEATR
ncbi:MAG: Rieske 2Fe-2S domain-containing protein [Proteobacteria bacterium]|nr:Rieske 2Fe-2S domain-containing protein [Pseudomonadota bacterium]